MELQSPMGNLIYDIDVLRILRQPYSLKCDKHLYINKDAEITEESPTFTSVYLRLRVLELIIIMAIVHFVNSRFNTHLIFKNC